MGRRIDRVGVVGTGLIGASWAACFLAQGLDVVATDPAPGAEERLRRQVDRAWPVLAELGLAAGASPDRIRFEPDLEAAVAEVDFVQESGPEREEVKRETFRRLDAATAPDVLLASSTSGLMPSLFQAGCRHPGRVLVGHPFNPPHLIPLVEVVGGRETAPEAIEEAMEFYARIGKRPIHIRMELIGHVANRLQNALYREAYHLVKIGAVSVSEVDAAIAHGPGLRWALMGPCLLQHLGGGEGGIRHALDHLGPFKEAAWADLGTPKLDEDLKDKLAAGMDEAMREVDREAMLRERDALMVALLKAKAAAGHLP